AEKARIELTDMDHLLRNADFITIHANLTPENYHMINRAAFEKMKKSAYIINCARGGIIDENDLYHALKDGKIAGAALDTFENEPPGETPLAELDNVIFTPHIGANTVEAQVKAGTIVAEQVLMALEGKEPVHWVNKP
ncbi:MAG TPA: phosphoglycerate dehydrogenase, partial [Thermoplasmatales archaeon]|nr:phosphoglycerate dehydrogenase [Thermoplasmatales archaeon]